ncbi:valine--tRNA ligase, partial [Candidatus Parcubacteria bacterium]|nr:valine--tRNA ligase [Candidatus Parcubacteria bacterium]
EVEHEEQQTKLYYFRYDKNFPITIATTRAETKLGDTAVAVNPKDERYKKYIGKKYQADFCGIDLSIKIIADRNVDMEFGTGALGVTPAHSATDWQMAQENDLKIIKVINEEGKINKGFGEFSGKTVLAAREMIVKKLQEQGIIEREENFVNNLSVCERCKTAIEPLVSEQWFVNVDHKNFSLKKEARKAIESGKIKIYPERFKDVMFSWIDNVHDWCISRQIWWGPRIPAWYKCQKSDIGNQISDIYVGINKPEDKVSSFAEATAGKWVQDSDTFDTWFSSGQWAYTALGFPDSADFKEFYPSNTMIMGRDNLSFWAFRMVILSLYRTGKIPFKNLYFTGLIRDAKGKKMSKSKGNGIEPLDMIEKYGTDAMRLSMMIGSTPGNDMNLSEEKIAGFRNMVNKIWNISRYIITNYTRQASTSELSNTNEKINLENLTDVDRWMLAEFSTLTDAKVTSVTKFLNRYEFSLAATLLQVATLDFFADWYLEASKFEKNEEKEKILFYILKNILKLWHPFIPFVTEVIWQELNMEKDLIISKWPDAKEYNAFNTNKTDTDTFEIIKEVIQSIRNARAENKIEPAKKIKAVIYAGEHVELVQKNEALIKGMRTGIQELEIKKSGKEIAREIKVVAGDVVVYLIGAIDKEKENARVEKEKANLEKQIEIIKNKLANKDFIERAPGKIVELEKEKLEKLEKELEEL